MTICRRVVNNGPCFFADLRARALSPKREKVRLIIYSFIIEARAEEREREPNASEQHTIGVDVRDFSDLAEGRCVY